MSMHSKHSPHVMANSFGRRPWGPHLGKIPSTRPAPILYGYTMMLVRSQSMHRQLGVERTYHGGRLAVDFICENVSLYVDVNVDIDMSPNRVGSNCLDMGVC